MQKVLIKMVLRHGGQYTEQLMKNISNDLLFLLKSLLNTVKTQMCHKIFHLKSKIWLSQLFWFFFRICRWSGSGVKLNKERIKHLNVSIIVPLSKKCRKIQELFQYWFILDWRYFYEKGTRVFQESVSTQYWRPS